MCTKVTSAGVSVQFCHPDGAPDGPPFFSNHVRLRGRSREQVIRLSGIKANREEIDNPGSDDWLTLIAIADSDKKLREILRASHVPDTEAHTSGSSRRVRIEMSVGGLRQSFTNRIVIASGPIISITPPKMHVVHVKILDGRAKMTARHPLIKEFKGNSIVFE